MKQKGDFTAWDQWDASMIPDQPDPGLSRPDYLDFGLESPVPPPAAARKKAKPAGTPIALVKRKPTQAERLVRTTSSKTA